MKGLFTCTGTGFEAFNDASREIMKKFKIGSVHQFDLKKKRDARFLAKYQVLVCDVIFPNQSFFKTERGLKEFLRLETECYESIEMPDKSIQRKTISPSFDNVPDDITFDKEYFQPTIQAGLLIMNGSTEEELRKQTDDLLGFA